jgi:Ala-tRNA(Pro) deacylase
LRQGIVDSIRQGDVNESAETPSPDDTMPLNADDLMALLDREGIRTRTVTHPPLHTVEESKALRGDIPGAHIKNLFLKDEKGAMFLFVARESTVIDLKTLWRRIGCKRLSFGKPELLWEVLGVRPGSVTPFALLNPSSKPVVFLWDASLDTDDLIAAHPLHNEATTVIARTDLLTLLARHGHEARRIDLSTPLAP